MGRCATWLYLYEHSVIHQQDNYHVNAIFAFHVVGVVLHPLSVKLPATITNTFEMVNSLIFLSIVPYLK